MFSSSISGRPFLKAAFLSSSLAIAGCIDTVSRNSEPAPLPPRSVYSNDNSDCTSRDPRQANCVPRANTETSACNSRNLEGCNKGYR
ncbi:hypothetical protein SAMN05216176_102235 [Nitratireductor indicus]|nr:hypothetical protein SAMN05216176_102235 [Nitratireductor indicus]